MKLEESQGIEEFDVKQSHYIFILGIVILFGWMIIILLCAYPQLFRNFLERICCWMVRRRDQEQQKVKLAKERVRSANNSLLGTSMAQAPSKILVSQVLGGSTIIDNKSLPSHMKELSQD